MKSEKIIVVRGGGDIATGTIHRLWSAGFPVLVLEAVHPAAIRRQVSLCEAVYEGETVIEGMKGIRIEELSHANRVIASGKVPVIVDPEGKSIKQLKPDIVVDAIMAKKNLGTNRQMARRTVALGPGFVAGKDVDIVIETQRGHNLGRIIRQGAAMPDTGIPGVIAGKSKERVIHAEAEGVIRNIHAIGDIVEQEEVIAEIENSHGKVPVQATITGVIRGMIREGYPVTEGFKIADIDPRKEELQNCFTISDKARCIAGSILEIVCAEQNREEIP